MTEKLNGTYVESPDDPIFGFVVYRISPAQKGDPSARYFLMLQQKRDQSGMEYQVHDSLDGAEEQILDAMTTGQVAVERGNFIIKALYWEGDKVRIPNSIPKEVR